MSKFCHKCHKPKRPLPHCPPKKDNKEECPTASDKQELAEITQHDLQTEIKLITQWPSPTIPADNYSKNLSVNHSLYFYLDLDPFTIKPDDPLLTVFLTGLQYRGHDQLGNNLFKRVYMSALTCDKLPLYKNVITNVLNQWYFEITKNAKPLLSSFQEAIIKLFLRLHIGPDDYPKYVIEYFDFFIDIIGFADPSRPGRDQQMFFGHCNNPRVREYFNKRATLIEQNKMKNTIIYHWIKAGLPTETLVTEAVHNIVAFSQFNNLLFKIVDNEIKPEGRKYFSLFKAAENEGEQLNVVREIYRLEVPNQVSFSSVVGEGVEGSQKGSQRRAQGGNTQSRHAHQPIMIANEGGLPQYAKFDTSRYKDFETSLSKCPYFGSRVNHVPPAEEFTRSQIDNETELPNSNNLIIPVFNPPTYTPFGLGYRRCAGEILVYFITIKLIKRICNLTFIQKEGEFPLIPLAPFTAVPDNLFVAKP